MATPRLLGPDGQPIRREVLSREISAPTTMGVRLPLRDHPSSGLTPPRLASLLRASEDGDMDAYLALAEDMEEKDLHYHAVLGTRKRAVAQLDISVEAASDDPEDVTAAELVEQLIEQETLEEHLVAILDAIGKGFSVTEIVWEISERQWFPARLEPRAPHWFAFDPMDMRTLLLREPEGNVPLAAYKFIPHIHSVKAGIPIRGGLARIAAWSFLFKAYGIRDWTIFAEVYGQPLRLGKYAPGASDREKETLLRAVASIGVDAAAIIPESMVIEFQEARSTTTDLHQRLVDFLDRQVSKAVLGQTLTTEVGSAGSLAAARVHDGVREDIERSDAKQLAATLNRWLVRPMIDLNLGPRKWYPRIVIGRAEPVDTAALSSALAQLVPLGLRVREAEVRQKLGLDEPTEDDEVLGSAPKSRNGAPPRKDEDADAEQPPFAAEDDLASASRAGGEADPAAGLAAELLGRSLPAGDAVVTALRAAVDGAGSLEEVTARLLRAEAPVAELADRLREALVLAELQGLDSGPG
jgi:phage gp29-like protein